MGNVSHKPRDETEKAIDAFIDKYFIDNAALSRAELEARFEDDVGSGHIIKKFVIEYTGKWEEKDTDGEDEEVPDDFDVEANLIEYAFTKWTANCTSIPDPQPS